PAQSRGAPARLPVPSALPGRGGALRAGSTGAARSSRRSSRRLPPGRSRRDRGGRVMLRFLASRLARALLTIAMVVTFAFVVLRLSGDPALLIMSVDAPPEAIAAFRAAW